MCFAAEGGDNVSLALSVVSPRPSKSQGCCRFLAYTDCMSSILCIGCPWEPQQSLPSSLGTLKVFRLELTFLLTALVFLPGTALSSFWFCLKDLCIVSCPQVSDFLVALLFLYTPGHLLTFLSLLRDWSSISNKGEVVGSLSSGQAFPMLPCGLWFWILPHMNCVSFGTSPINAAVIVGVWSH